MGKHMPFNNARIHRDRYSEYPLPDESEKFKDKDKGNSIIVRQGPGDWMYAQLSVNIVEEVTTRLGRKYRTELFNTK